MSNDNRYSFDNLTQSGLAKLTSKEDKNIALSINCFGGSMSFSVFTGGGGKPFSLTIKRQSIYVIGTLLQQMIADPRPCRQGIPINTWDQEAKRSKNIGQLAFGIDENLIFQIELSHEQLNGGARYTFPVKKDFTLDFSNTSLSEKDLLAAAVTYIHEILTTVAPIAERLTSFKRPQGNFGGGGGNRGGYGGGNRGGGNYNNNDNGGGRSSTFGNSGGGSNVSEDDMSF